MEPVIPNVASPITNAWAFDCACHFDRDFDAMGVRSACDHHDECYGARANGLLQPENRWKARKKCDDTMHSEGRSRQGCLRVRRALEPGSIPSCLEAVEAFHQAIRHGGHDAFMSARKKACRISIRGPQEA